MMMKLRRVLIMPCIMLAPSVRASEESFTFSCLLKKTLRIYDLSGGHEDHQEPQETVLIRASHDSFQIFLTKKKIWSDNLCLPELPEYEQHTGCQMTSNDIDAHWFVEQVDHIHNAQNRWAQIGMWGRETYKIHLKEDGIIELDYRKYLKFSGTAYYDVLPNGSKRYLGPMMSARENWAGYSLDTAGAGLCDRVS